MKVLHVTDTHLGVERAVRGGPPGWSRAEDHLAALAAALRDAEERGVGAIVHSGDLFDRSRPPARWVLEGERLLREAARWAQVLVIPGNHDRRGLQRWLPSPRLEVFDRPARAVVGGVAFGLVPYLGDAGRFAEAVRGLGGVDVLVAHQAFDGVRIPGRVFRVGVERETVGARHLPRGLRWVWSGHFHPRQVVDLGDVRVVYPGSTERTAWIERAETKGWAIWDLAGPSGDGVPWRFVDHAARPMVEVERPDDLARVRVGALVRAPAELEREVLARGGRLDGPPAASAPRAWAPRAPDPPQPALFGPVGRLPVSRPLR